MNLANVLKSQAAQRPNQAALIAREGNVTRSVTFLELHEQVGAVARQFDLAGLQPGDAVLVFHSIGIDLYVGLLAMFHRGLTAVFVDPGQGGKFLESCCQVVSPKAFLGSPKAHLLRLVHSPLRRASPAFHFQGWIPNSTKLRPDARDRGAAALDLGDSHPALITFTSGSTGRPKGIVRSHGFLMAQHRALERNLRLTPGAVDLATLPIFVLANLASGLTSVLADCDWGKVSQADARRIGTQIIESRVTRLSASPAFLRQLLQPKTAVPQLEHLFTGGAPVFPSLLQALHEKFPEAAIEAVYGSTEAEPISHLAWESISASDLELMKAGKGLLVGEVIPELDAAIIKAKWGEPIGEISEEDFRLRTCSTGEIGEIVVSGDHVVSGYLNGQGDEESKFRAAGQAWHRTGDAGYFDPQRRLWLVGRCAAAVESADKKILYPFQLETALSFFPQIIRSALIQHEGRTVLAVEQSGGDDSWQPIALAFGVEKIVHLPIPVDKRHNAKVDYPALRKKLGRAK